MWTVTISRSVRGVAIESYLFRNTTTCGCGFEIAVQIAVSVPKPFQRTRARGSDKKHTDGGVKHPYATPGERGQKECERK